MTRRAPCHPDRQVWAYGLCKPCADRLDYLAARAEVYEIPAPRPRRRTRSTGTGWPDPDRRTP